MTTTDSFNRPGCPARDGGYPVASSRLGRKPAMAQLQRAALAAAWVTALALGACGGGGDSSQEAAPAPTDQETVTTSYATLEKDAAASVTSVELQVVTAARPVGAGVLPLPVIAYCGRHDDWRNCGDRATFTLLVNGQTREFIVWRPKTAAQRQNVPVVFMLHGSAQSGEQFWNISAWREKALREGVFAVFPSALKHCLQVDSDNDPSTPEEVTLETKWADSQVGSDERPLCTQTQIDALSTAQRAGLATTLADDIGFVRAMVADVKARFPRSDAKRQYITGFSNGSAMTHRVAAELSSLFAAAHGSAGPMPSQVAAVTVASRPISIVHTVGSEDDAKVQYGYPVSIPLTEQLMADPTNQRYHNRVVLPSLAVLQIPDVYTYSNVSVSGKVTSRFTYATSPRGNLFRTIVIEGAIHEYPNGRNHPVVLAEELWPFFSANSLP